MTDIYRACLVAEPTPFYRALRDLWRRGLFVGPVITNNFDCQCADLGLPEISLRRYDWRSVLPGDRARSARAVAAGRSACTPIAGWCRCARGAAGCG